LTLFEPQFGSLVPTATPEFDTELASRAAMGTEVRSLLRSGQERRAAEVLIDWTQGGPGGFAALPTAARDALLSNAKTMGPTFAVAAPNVTCDDLRSLRVPTLVVHGSQTRVYYRLVAEAVVSCVGGAVVAEVPDAHHMLIVEQPNGAAATMRAFLREH
jgi:pimeloyl-ACP methyl ester carboxylesterase